MKKRVKDFFDKNPKIKKIVGIILVIIGILIIITPLTPGSWIIFVGFELLGIRFLAQEKIKNIKLKKLLNFFKRKNDSDRTIE